MESLKGIWDEINYNLDPHSSGAALFGRIRSLGLFQENGFLTFSRQIHSKKMQYAVDDIGYI